MTCVALPTGSNDEPERYIRNYRSTYFHLIQLTTPEAMSCESVNLRHDIVFHGWCIG